MPETAAGRDRMAFKQAELHRSHQCDTCEAEARALGRAEALAAVRTAVEGLPGSVVTEYYTEPDWISRPLLLAAIDNLEEPHA